MFFFVNINTTKRHPLSRMPFMLPGMSGWRSLNQANRNGRTRTFDTLVKSQLLLPTELRSDSASGLKTAIVIADTTHAEAPTLSAAIKSGIVNLSEVLRIRSVHPGATRPHPLPSCDPRQRFQGN